MEKKDYILNSGRNLILRAKALEIFREFMERDIDFIVTKGLYLAFEVYPDPGLRRMADIDLLIKKKDLEEISRILDRLGYREVSKRPQREYGCDSTFCDENRVYVDIHWDLCQYERFKNILSLSAQFRSRACGFDLEGVEIKTLSPEDHMLYVGLHFGLFDLLQGTNGVYDLFYLSQKKPIKWDVLVENAGKFGIKTPLYYSLLRSKDIAGLKVPGSVIEKLRPGFLRRKMIAYLLFKHSRTFPRYLCQALMMRGILNSLRVLLMTLKAVPRTYRRSSPANFINTAADISA